MIVLYSSIYLLPFQINQVNKSNNEQYTIEALELSLQEEKKGITLLHTKNEMFSGKINKKFKT